MPLTINKPYLGLRIAAHDGDLVFVPREGFCDGIVLDTPYIGLRAATHDGSLVYVINDQKLEADGTLTIDKPYIALRAATHDDSLVYVIAGKDCEGVPDYTVCDCTICCTLDASVQVGNGVAGDPWSDAADISLICGGSFSYNSGHSCLNDLIEDDTIFVVHTHTYSERDTIGSPEAYSYVDGGAVTHEGTYEVKSGIWSGDEFVIDGETYRLTYLRAEATIYETEPVELTDSGCYEAFILQRWYEDTFNGVSYWVTVATTGSNTLPAPIVVEHGASPPYGVYNVSTSPDYECPEGYSYNGGELDVDIFRCDNHPTGGGDPYTGGNSFTGVGDCPIAVVLEWWYRLAALPDTEENRIKCAKITIADLCE